MRHLHIAFVVITFLLIVVVLLTPRAGESGEAASQDVALERSYADSPTGLVCCTWRDGAQERRCVAASGQTCDVCAGACA